MTALEYFRQPMEYQTFLGGGVASRADTVKLLSKIERDRQTQFKAEKIKKKIADNRLVVND